MTPLQKRIALFLVGCMGTRLALVEIARRATPTVLGVLGGLAVLPAVGFFLIYATHSRTKGPETFGAPIWWNHLRPIHGTFYAVFAYLAFLGNPKAWMVLLADAIVGFLAFLHHHLFPTIQ
jgi:hypothetical protein